MLKEDQSTRRTARQSRPQLVCILADNSGSMRGPKAQAATQGIREMLLRCQTTGPRGPDRSYFQLLLIHFGSTAEIDERAHLTPVRQIDSDTIEVRGDGGGTNITEALQLAHEHVERYLRTVVEPHAERSEYPLPLVLLFSDGRNGYGHPEPVGEKLKALNVDGQPIVVACAGVATEDSDRPDESLLRAIASPECYVPIDQANLLSSFLAEVGSSGVSSAAEVSQVIERIQDSESAS